MSSRLRELIAGDRRKATAIAKKLDINKSTFHNWVYGSALSSLLALVRLSKYFDRSLDELCLKQKSQSTPCNQITIHLKLDNRSLKIGDILTEKNDYLKRRL